MAELEEVVAQFGFSVTYGQTLSICLSGKDTIYAIVNLLAVEINLCDWIFDLRKRLLT